MYVVAYKRSQNIHCRKLDGREPVIVIFGNPLKRFLLGDTFISSGFGRKWNEKKNK